MFKKLSLFAFVTFLSLTLFSWSQPQAWAQPLQNVPIHAKQDCVVIDNDFDIDDMMAIPLVMANKHVAAIITTEGYTLADLGGSALARLIAQPDNMNPVPVIVGASYPGTRDVRQWPWLLEMRATMHRANMLFSGPLLAEIRKITAYNPSALPTQKDATRNWLRGMSNDYPIALTLTLKQSWIEKRNSGVVICRLNREHCDNLAKRFTQKLNRAVFGHSAHRHNKKLNYIIVVEGERSNNNLHLHLAIGNLPSHVKYSQLDQLVTEAKLHMDGIDKQHDIKAADSGWVEYITKEVGRNDTDNVLWQLA